MMTALMIGAGIAGTSAAMALQRAGIDAILCEAHHETAHTVGAFLTIAVNGLDAFEAIGMRRHIMDAGFASRRISFVSGSGKQLGAVPIGGELQDGTVTHTIKRGDLYRLLYDEARARGIRMLHGKRLVHAESHARGVVARFDDGTELAADLLVGADGIHSRTRAIIDPSAPSPRYTGLGNIGGFTRGLTVDTPPGDYVMLFGKRGFFGYAVHPSGEIWWFANPPRARELSREELAATTSEEWRARTVELFLDDASSAAEIVRSTPGTLVGFNQYDMPRVPHWSRGRMIVIGDAAHAAAPSSGQGASMAIEDAVTLAIHLRDAGDVERAFAGYERARRARVERVVRHGARSASTKVAGPVGRVIRDAMLPLVFKGLSRAGPQQWLFGHHIEWSRSEAGT